ncbi:MlaD family protein [Chthonobacter rhizosphaerae]|uniref:MlaD family protein n=1 Tax=Chthonobacter rhizosphaerae TaxID=2735553 RepID=UPI0015EEB3A0|nr:MlaD family protein [Chthonobacter rhizosphaerae]
MESRANYAAIGLFVLVMLMTGLGFLYWLTNAGERARQVDVRVVFNGAVTGLNTGSAVLFNGIKIGEVARLTLDDRDPNTVVAIISVDRTTPIRTDTRATLSYQGLTGVANLQLEGGSRNAPLLVDAVPEDNGTPTIQAEVSPFQDIIESARNVLTKADNAMTAIDEFVTENRPAVSRTVANVETFSRALSDNAGAVSGALENVGRAAEAVGDISGDLRGSAERLEQLLTAVEPDQVRTAVTNLVTSAERLNTVLTRAEQVANGIDPAAINQAVTNVSSAAASLNDTIQRAGAVVEAIEPAEVDRLMASLATAGDDVSAAAKRADGLLASVDPARVGQIVTSVDVVSQNLADVSATVGTVVSSVRDTFDKAGTLIGAVDTEKVRSTVDDVSSFAGTLESYTPQVNSILADVKSASESLRRLGATIDERNGDVNRTITEARNLVQQLNGIATRADGVLQKVDAYVEGDGEGLIQEATATLQSIRQVADTLGAQVGPITANVARFSERGLNGFAQLAEDGRRALSRLDRVLSGIEQNPQQFIFGGDGVPEYQPRRR